MDGEGERERGGGGRRREGKQRKRKTLSCHFRHMDDEMAKDIENSVLDRCSPHGDVVHVYIDRRSPFVSHLLPVT